MPGFDVTQEKNWNRDRYHTAADDKDTYNADVMTTNLNMFGALAIYIDKTPALQIDLTADCDDLEEALNEDLAKESGVDTEAYKEALNALRTQAEALNERIETINANYEKAVAEEASEEEINAIIEEGRAVNELSLQAFKDVQDDLIGIVLTSDVVIKHDAYQRNISTIDSVIQALEAGNLSNEEDGSGAVELAAGINGGAEFGYYNFSRETSEESTRTLLEDTNKGNLFWGTGKGYELADTSEATLSLLKKAQAQKKNASYEEEIAIYNSAREEQLGHMKTSMEKETKAMKRLTKKLKAAQAKK